MPHLSSIRQQNSNEIKKSLNDLHVTVCLKTYIQPKTIKIMYKIFSKTYQHLKYLQDLAFGRQSCLQRVKVWHFLKSYNSLMTVMSLKNTECCLGYRDYKGRDF